MFITIGNGYDESSSNPIAVCLYFILIPLEKIWIQLFFLQLRVNSRANQSRRRKALNLNLQNSTKSWPSVASLSSGGIYIYIYIYMMAVLSVSSVTTTFVSCPLKIQYGIAIHLMRWLTNFYDFRFKSTATAAIGIHPTKAWWSQLVNFKNTIWTWGHFRRMICNNILF